MVTLPNQIVCYLIIYIDAGITAQNTGMKVEPVAFTLGIFNQSTRNKPSAWHHLGYVNNLDSDA